MDFFLVFWIFFCTFVLLLVNKEKSNKKEMSNIGKDKYIFSLVFNKDWNINNKYILNDPSREIIWIELDENDNEISREIIKEDFIYFNDEWNKDSNI